MLLILLSNFLWTHNFAILPVQLISGCCLLQSSLWFITASSRSRCTTTETFIEAMETTIPRQVFSQMDLSGSYHLKNTCIDSFFSRAICFVCTMIVFFCVVNIYKGSQREKRLNTVPYFTLLGQIISIYRHTKTVYGNIQDRIQAFFMQSILNTFYIVCSGSPVIIVIIIYEFLPRIFSSVLIRLLLMRVLPSLRNTYNGNLAISSERLSSPLRPVEDSNQWLT